MRISTMIRIAALAALAVLCVQAADVSGKWKAEFNTPDGQKRESTFTFKVDGGKLTGTIASQQGEAQISDGKVSGDDISFTVVRNFNGDDVKLQYKGKVSGNDMKLTVEFGDRSFEMSAKRSTT